MCIPTFVGFFLFHLFFSLFLSFSFSFLSVSPCCGSLWHFLFFLFPFVCQPLNSPTPRSIPIFFHQVFFSLVNGTICKVPPSPPPHYLSLLTIPLLTPAGDQLVVRGGNAHFFTYTRIRSRETGENKTDEQTRTKLGVNQEQRKVCNTTCMCRLSLAWVTSENSTSTSNADILSRSSSLDPILSPTVSGVRC